MMNGTVSLIEPWALGYPPDAVLVHPLARIWPEVEELLAPAITRSGGRLSPATVFDALWAGDMQLWLAYDREGNPIGAVVTEIAIYRTGLKTVRGLLLGGRDMQTWLPAVAHEIEAWARGHGCRYVEGGGRKGFERATGWKAVGTEYEKDLSDA